MQGTANRHSDPKANQKIGSGTLPRLTHPLKSLDDYPLNQVLIHCGTHHIATATWVIESSGAKAEFHAFSAHRTVDAGDAVDADAIRAA